MICRHCGEPIAADEDAVEDDGQVIAHARCFLRVVAVEALPPLLASTRQVIGIGKRMYDA